MIDRELAQFELFVLYYSFVVYDSSVHEVFNDWKEEHARQGFSWRPGNVSFGTLDTLHMSIQVTLAEIPSPHPGAARAIRVPFSVTPESIIKVAVVTEARTVHVPAGAYALTYEHGMCESGDKMWCRLTFVPDPEATPAILVADAELSNPPDPLVMEAEPV